MELKQRDARFVDDLVALAAACRAVRPVGRLMVVERSESSRRKVVV